MKRTTKTSNIGAAITALVSGKPAIPAEIVAAAAKVAGAKQGKDAVPAGKDYTKTLIAIRDTELGFIQKQVNLQGDRMACWQQVALLAESAFKSVDGKNVNTVLRDYPKMLQTGLLESAGLKRNAEGEFPAREEWPQAIRELYERHLSKRLSETKKVMTALDQQYTLTRQVLEGRGTIHQKLVALPNVSNKGRKAGSAGKEKAKGATGDATAKDALKSIGVALKTLPFASFPEVVEMMEAHAKQRAEYKKAGNSADFINALKAAREKYETVMQLGRKAA